jgi:hypothetical protein
MGEEDADNEELPAELRPNAKESFSSNKLPPYVFIYIAVVGLCV